MQHYSLHPSSSTGISKSKTLTFLLLRLRSYQKAWRDLDEKKRLTDFTCGSTFNLYMDLDKQILSRYNPGPDFDEDNRVPILPISMSSSTELWLIQWPINQLQPADFHGKELSVKLHRDGKLASFVNSSGKSYEVVSYAAQTPEATVFLPSSSDLKVVGKISRRICLVRYPEPGEFDKPSLSKPGLSGLKLEGSKMKTLSHLPTISKPGTDRSSRETLTSGHSIGQGIMETSQQQSRKKKHKERTPASASTRSIGRSSLASEPESQMTSTAIGSSQSHGEKKSKKRKIKAEE